MKDILEYLADLVQNNNREWYHSNKGRLKKANTEFEHLIGKLICAIGEFDYSIINSTPKDLTFKLVRDNRSSGTYISDHETI